MSVAIGTVLIIAAFLLIYSGFRGTSPMQEIQAAFAS